MYMYMNKHFFIHRNLENETTEIIYAHYIPGMIALFIPPPYKKSHFHPVKCPVRVVLKFLYDCV